MTTQRDVPGWAERVPTEGAAVMARYLTCGGCGEEVPGGSFARHLRTCGSNEPRHPRTEGDDTDAD